MDFSVEFVGLSANHEEIFLLSVSDYLQQIILQLSANQDRTFDIVLVDKILLAEQGFILSSNVLMQQIDLGQMIRCQNSIVAGPLPHKTHVSA